MRSSAVVRENLSHLRQLFGDAVHVNWGTGDVTRFTGCGFSLIGNIHNPKIPESSESEREPLCEHSFNA